MLSPKKTKGLFLRVSAAFCLLLSAFIDVAYSTGCHQVHTGSIPEEPVHLYSKGGSMNVHLYFQTGMNSDGTTECCFLTKDGTRSPTLHLVPGGNLTLTVTNLANPDWPSGGKESATTEEAMNDAGFHQQVMDGAINIHFHGMFVSPALGQDDVFMLISPGSTFTYHVPVPVNHPPGVYWYHPHNHGYSEMTVLGGATGLLIVDGIEQSIPRLGDMPYRTLTLRDVVRTVSDGGSGFADKILNSVTQDPAPTWDVSLNFFPVKYPLYVPVQIPVRPASQEFWRIAHAGANSVLNLQLVYDGIAQLIKVVALDGVPVNAPEGYLEQQNVFLPASSRADIIIEGPDASVKRAELVTLKVDTGPAGDSDPFRRLAILTSGYASSTTLKMPSVKSFPTSSPQMTVQQLAYAAPNRIRHLYFSQEQSDPSDLHSPTKFFITVEGQQPKLFDPANGPSIVTRQGEIEDWVIVNKANEVHEFHIHQVHFIVLEVNHQAIPLSELQFQDIYQTPYWDGSGPYPSIKIRMAFAEIDVGSFVYHCHMLGHEDKGMMATIQVLPAGAPIPAEPSEFDSEMHKDQTSKRSTGVTVGATGLGAAIILSALSCLGILKFRNRIGRRKPHSTPACVVNIPLEYQGDIVLCTYADTGHTQVHTEIPACATGSMC